MAQIGYRANLNSVHFPFLSQLHGRSIIVPAKDQAFSQSLLATRDDDDKDSGKPQVYYCHNVMPSAEGLQSVGYKDAIDGLVDEDRFWDIFVLRNMDEQIALYAPAKNRNYVFEADVPVWTAHTELPNRAENDLVTVAYLSGHTYVFLYREGCFEYNHDTHEFDEVELVGLDSTKINGITSSSGFLIAWDDLTVYRSQAVLNTDFTPDPSLGSGSSIPEELRGLIVVCLPIANGFIIYTTQNAVGASFSQNIRFPFIYKEVKGSAGIIQPRHVAWQDNIGEHYAWTEAGLQRVNKAEATIIFPAVTDFLTSKLLEDFSASTNSFTITKLTIPVKLRIATVTKRYVIISYGQDGSNNNNYTQALIYDIAYKRFGKVKITHVAAFEFFFPDAAQGIPWEDLDTFLPAPSSWEDFGDMSWEEIIDETEITERTRELIAFLQEDGTVKLLNFDSVHINDNAILILGKYQYIRERWITIEEINIEVIEQEYTDFILRVLASIDGKNIYSATNAYLHVNNGTYRQYLNSVQGFNESLLFVGTFHLADVDMKIKIEGRV